MDNNQMLIIGANGQLGKALSAQYPDAQGVDIDQLDISDRKSVELFDWTKIKTVINAAAYTNVDGAETPEGRTAAWRVNGEGVANLVAVAAQKDITLVHISTDYVFDGARSPHKETEAFSPLSVYGSSKAAGDLLVSLLQKFYIMRTSWVIGDGKNFVRTMLEAGTKGVNPAVVSDQIGRLTFTSELVRAIGHVLESKAPYGTYNVSNGGPPSSWSNIAQAVFQEARFPNTVTEISSKEYYKKKGFVAQRPPKSTLDLAKIQATGFEPHDWREDLKIYIQKERSQ